MPLASTVFKYGIGALIFRYTPVLSLVTLSSTDQKFKVSQKYVNHRKLPNKKRVNKPAVELSNGKEKQRKREKNSLAI